MRIYISLILTAIGLIAAFIHYQQEPTGPLQPLPDYPAAYRQLSIDLQPVGENGWELFMQITDLHREVAQRHNDDAFFYHDQGMVDYTLLWEPDSLNEEYTIDTQIPRIEAQIADARESGLLDELAQLATKDNLVQPADESSLLLHILPQLGTSRSLARLNGARMVLAAQSGDNQELLDACRQSLWLSRHVSASSPVMIGDLVGISIEMLTLERVREAIIHQQISASTAARLLAMIDAQLPMPATTIAFDAEQMMILDTIARLYTDDGHGDGRIVTSRLDFISDDDLDGKIGFDAPAIGRGSRTFASKRQVLTRQAKIHTDQLDILAAPPQKRRALENALDDSLAQRKPAIPTGTANLLLELLRISAVKFAQTNDQYALELAATRIMLAIEVYRAEHGVPATLDALVPVYLSALPIDPFTRAPIIYRPAPEAPLGYVLYSAGFDQEDNHGLVDPHLRYPMGSLQALGVGSDYPFVPVE